METQDNDTIWRAAAQDLISRLTERFITVDEFNKELNVILQHQSCPLSALLYLVECPDPEIKFIIGIEGTGREEIHNYTVTDNRNTLCRIRYWAKGTSFHRLGGLNELLERLFDSFWKPQLRTVSAGLPDLKRDSEARSLANNTVAIYSENGKPCSLLFCDLDNFGQVNKIISHAAGDRIIKVFGAALERACANNAIFLHNGGDEFLLLLPGAQIEQALSAAYVVKQEVDSCDFETDNRNHLHQKVSSELMFPELSVSIGIAATEENVLESSFDQLVTRANEALNRHAKGIKGVARFVPAASQPSQYKDIAEALDHSLCLIKSDSLSETPFANIWLNEMSRIVSQTAYQHGISKDTIQDVVDRFVLWSHAETSKAFKGACSNARSNELDISPDISSIDWAFAVAHGLLNAVIFHGIASPPFDLLIVTDKQYLNAGLIGTNGSVLWSSNTGETDINYSIGSFWQMDRDVQIDRASSSRALLIRIGNQPINLPDALFAETIIVDDRPTGGGGLPDFWEATIARLVSHITRNKNIAAVYVVGDYAKGAHTVKRLQEIDKWKAQDEQLAYKTGTPIGEIRYAADFLRSLIVLSENEAGIVSHLAHLLRPAHTISPMLLPIRTHKRFLRRPVDTLSMRLKDLDGCRVRTITEAYPIVLDIVRQENIEDLVFDQAGQPLRELVDFKVHLTNPLQDQIPIFYSEDKKLLDAYFNKEFVDEGGLFSRYLISQQDAVISHLAKAIQSRQPYSTRRAILVIPNIIKENQDVQPLGLVSVRVYPRFISGRIRLNYSLTWRTVEALVGFPYSLYGSVRYGAYITEKIREVIPVEHRRRLEMGEISYIAHSLHFFMDDYGQNIARKIVDEASA